MFLKNLANFENAMGEVKILWGKFRGPRDIRNVVLFVFGATAPSGPGPPHSRGF
jgi:hypothetical protein